MDKEQFDTWYRENIETMSMLGVLHPDSPFGKTVHLAIASLQPQINTINDRLSNIEKILDTDYVPSETKQKIKAPVAEVVKKTVELEKKVEEIQTRTRTRKPRTPPKPEKKVEKVEQPKSSGGWQISKTR